jgi:hypothetical protein
MNLTQSKSVKLCQIIMKTNFYISLISLINNLTLLIQFD